MSNIFQISQDILDIFQEIEENDGELTPELEEKLKCSQDDFKTKVENYTKVIKSAEGNIKTIDDEIKRLTALKKSKQNTIDRLEKIIVWAVETFGDTTKSGGKYLDFGTGKVNVRVSEKVEVDDDAATNVVNQFMEQIRQIAYTKELDKNDIEDLVTIPDEMINGVTARLQVDVPLKDFYGPAGNILRALYDSNKLFKYAPNISKTELKSELKENPDAYPHLAHITKSKSITIK